MHKNSEVLAEAYRTKYGVLKFDKNKEFVIKTSIITTHSNFDVAV